MKVRAPLHVVILAAGKGLRMRSQLPKVLHKICGEPLLTHVIRCAQQLRPTKIHVVVNKQAPAVRELVRQHGASCVEQEVINGTAGATQVAVKQIPSTAAVLVLFGDTPLVEPVALRKLVKVARSGGLGLRTMEPEIATGYSRVVYDRNGALADLVTEKVATPTQRLLREVDAGGTSFPAGWGKQALAKVKKQPYGELVLTDLVALAHAEGMRTRAVKVPPHEGLGANSTAQLLLVQAALSAKRVTELTAAGVLFADPNSVVIYGKLTAQPDTFIDHNVLFEGEVRLAAGSVVGPNCVVRDTTLAEGARLHAFTHAQGATLAKDAQAGPFARLREGSRLEAGAKVGNFVETKATRLGPGSKANHLAYLGDSDIGAAANIGAGTIFCNYDGVNKHHTHIGADSFIGSGSMLVAPVEVGAGALVAAGSVITTDVPAGQLAVGRSRQRNVQRKKAVAKAPAKRKIARKATQPAVKKRKA